MSPLSRAISIAVEAHDGQAGKRLAVDSAIEAEEELKLWLAVRADLHMPLGKLATQAGHGFSHCLVSSLKECPGRFHLYMQGATPKITVQVKGEAELQRVADEADAAGITRELIVDAARTFFPEPTPTVCAFGPALRSELPSFLKRLRLL